MRGLVVQLQPSQSSPEGSGATDGNMRPQNGAHRACTILIVEDEILTRLAAADHLRDRGFRVLEAADAEEARTLLRAAEPIELVFSDINMPGMDGIALAQWIAKEFPDVKIVLTSGDPRNADAARTAAYYLEKPYNLDSLDQLVRKLL